MNDDVCLRDTFFELGLLSYLSVLGVHGACQYPSFQSISVQTGVFIIVSSVRLFARDTPLCGDVIFASAVLTEHFVEHVEV